MSAIIRIISSMATRQLLADIDAELKHRSAQRVSIESVGGVDAARRVRAGEAFDVIVLASDVIDQLMHEGRIVAGSRVDLARSGVSVAVRAGVPEPGIATEDELRQAVLAAGTISYSTGPSGTHLARLFERWGITGQIQDRIVKAPPGVPVGSLVARGEVELGFQQLSELIHLPGIRVLGPLPPEVQIVTTFSAGLSASSTQGETVRQLLDFMASPATEAAKRAHGMEPA